MNKDMMYLEPNSLYLTITLPEKASGQVWPQTEYLQKLSKVHPPIPGLEGREEFEYGIYWHRSLGRGVWYILRHEGLEMRPSPSFGQATESTDDDEVTGPYELDETYFYQTYLPGLYKAKSQSNEEGQEIRYELERHQLKLSPRLHKGVIAMIRMVNLAPGHDGEVIASEIAGYLDWVTPKLARVARYSFPWAVSCFLYTRRFVAVRHAAIDFSWLQQPKQQRQPAGDTMTSASKVEDDGDTGIENITDGLDNAVLDDDRSLGSANMMISDGSSSSIGRSTTSFIISNGFSPGLGFGDSTGFGSSSSGTGNFFDSSFRTNSEGLNIVTDDVGFKGNELYAQAIGLAYSNLWSALAGQLPRPILASHHGMELLNAEDVQIESHDRAPFQASFTASFQARTQGQNQGNHQDQIELRAQRRGRRPRSRGRHPRGGRRG